MNRRGWLVLAVLAAVGCGGGVKVPGLKYKEKALEAVQVVEVDDDTEAWVLVVEKKPADEPYLLSISADQPVGVSVSSSLTLNQLIEGHDGKSDAKTHSQFITFPDQKEHTIQGTIGANYGLTVLVVRGKGAGPAKVTIKRER